VARFATRVVLVGVLFLIFCTVAEAQRAEAGFYGEYLGFSPAALGGPGIKGLLAINLHIALEGEFAYEFNRTFNETTLDPSGATSVIKSRMHATNLLAGVAFSKPSPKIRPFVTMKMGLLTINPSSLPAPLVSTNTILNDIRASHRNFAIFPAAGVEAYSGRWGFRLDIGDELYFLHGAKSNVRITFGPNYIF